LNEDQIIVDGVQLERIIESVIFASTEPLPVDRILECIQREEINESVIEQTIRQLNVKYESLSLGFRIIKIAGGYQFATHPQYDRWLSRLFKSKADRKLSQSSLEVLAIIAYRQPITRAEIEKIRGVNADWTLRSLMEKNLVTVVGREDAPGRPLLFGTTRQFLEHFGLNAISELPKLKEIEEILKEDKEFAQTLEFDFTGQAENTINENQSDAAEPSEAGITPTAAQKEGIAEES